MKHETFILVSLGILFRFCQPHLLGNLCTHGENKKPSKAQRWQQREPRLNGHAPLGWAKTQIARGGSWRLK